jgi:hypothetical protein
MLVLSHIFTDFIRKSSIFAVFKALKKKNVSVLLRKWLSTVYYILLEKYFCVGTGNSF